MDTCPAGQLIGAVLGTFFGTLLLCTVLATIIFVVYRRHAIRLQSSVTRQESNADAGKKQVAPPVNSVKVYTNAGFHESETYETSSTLAVRQPEIVRPSIVSLNDTNDSVRPYTVENGDIQNLQESVVRLVLGKQDIIETAFQLQAGNEDGKPGGIFMSDILPGASTLLQTVVSPGDELLSININMARDLSVADVRTVLRLVSDCPVRLTLRRRRRPSTVCPTSPTIVASATCDTVEDITDNTAGRNNDMVVLSLVSNERNAFCQNINSDGNRRGQQFKMKALPRPSSGGLTRWQSEPTTAVRRPEVDGGDSGDDDVGVGLPIDAEYHGYMIDPLPERAQSLTDVKLLMTDTHKAMTSSRSAVSDDELYVTVVVDGNGSRQRDVIVGKSAPNLTSPSIDNKSHETDSLDMSEYVSVSGQHGVEVANIRSDKDEDDNSYVNVDLDSLEKALAAGRQTPNTTGLDNALRAKEKASRGGMAYYVDLESHFDSLRTQTVEQSQIET